MRKALNGVEKYFLHMEKLYPNSVLNSNKKSFEDHEKFIVPGMTDTGRLITCYQQEKLHD